jgi:hypothetical protein
MQSLLCVDVIVDCEGAICEHVFCEHGVDVREQRLRERCDARLATAADQTTQLCDVNFETVMFRNAFAC